MNRVSNLENASILVRPGQIWADNDKRSAGRKVKVIRIQNGFAQCEVIALAPGVRLGLGYIKKLRIDRFRPTSTGYLLLEDPNTGYVRPEGEPTRWMKPENSRGKGALVAEKPSEKSPAARLALKHSNEPTVAQKILATRIAYEKAENARVAMPPAASSVISPEVAWEAEVPVDFICLIHPKYPTDSETVDNYYAKNAKKIWDAARADLLSA